MMDDPEDLYYRGKLWGAKDNQFWCLLSSLLISCKPKSILELGAGRSTTFFAEYADAASIKFISVEESPSWYAEVYRDLRFMFLPGTHIRHVPIDPSTAWYDRDLIGAALDADAYDLIMVDGPSGRAIRDQRGNDILDMAMRKARMVIVDDTHRDDCRAFSHYVTQRRGFTTSVDVTYKQRRRGPTTGLVVYDNNTATISTSEWSDIVSLQIANIYGKV
jgi:predicted O-methyltransferase YrrM